MKATLLILSASAVLVGATGAMGPGAERVRPVPALETIRVTPARTAASPADDLVGSALEALSPLVRRQSHPQALRRAVQAYFAFKTAHPEQVRKPFLYYVDYGLNSRTPRGYIFDMQALRVVDGPFTVAHGRGSEGIGGIPTRFSNRNGSNATSLGLYLAQETYAFSGSSGSRRYRSIGLRLRGLSGRFNSAARSRGVVAHGAPYVTPSRAGRSEGCPAMEEARARRLLPQLSNGGMVYLFSPRDPVWMREEPWYQRSYIGRALRGEL